MNVCHWVFQADSLTYLVAKALISKGYRVDIWITDPDYGKRALNWWTQRLVKMSGVRLLVRNVGALPDVIDRLIIQVFPRPLQYCGTLGAIAMRSRRLTLITAGDRSRLRSTAYKLQWKELRKLGRWWSRVDRIMYKDGFYPFDLYMFLKSRRVLGFDVSSGIMEDQDAFESIQKQDWNPETIRPIRINFIGSRDPAARTYILKSVRPLFDRMDQSPAMNLPRKRFFWHEFSDAQPNILPPAEFVDRLSESDFTLCPRGYSVITHRPIEALLRGSIPVLRESELDIYDISLEDGKNCIAVSSDDWPAAIERCVSISEGTVIDMRHRITAMVKDQLLYPASAKRMRVRLGFGE